MPRLAMMRESLHGGGHLSGRHQHFHVADGVPLNREHWKLVVVLVVALAVDVMKPATLGFVMSGMSLEYSISTPTASVLALVALMGTSVGSIAGGRRSEARRVGVQGGCEGRSRWMTYSYYNKSKTQVNV